MVYFCYIDESGTPQVPGNTSHYVLCGISIPVKYWKKCDISINRIKAKYGLSDSEIHTGWINRPYIEQTKIHDFEKMSYEDRRSEVLKQRKAEIFRVKKKNDSKALNQLKKNYKQTEAYIHLTYDERIAFIQEVADQIGSWNYARIFAECIDKVFFDPAKSKFSTDEQAFEQVVSRFEHYLANLSHGDEPTYGLLIHDNNDTVSKKHTDLMKRFHKQGTFWTSVKHIIETPLYVNSELTGMVQIADLCSVALRRFFENGETDLLDRIKPRFDAHRGTIVGVRHFTDPSCQCEICKSHIKVQ